MLRFDDFDNGRELFIKIQSGEIKLEGAKKLQNIFKSNLNKISRGRNKSEEQNTILKNVILLYNSREVVTKLFNDYYWIVSELNTKQFIRKGIPSMLARVACVAKVSDHSNLEMLSPKQMLQGLPISLTQVKADNTSEKLLNEIRQTMYSLYWPKETTKKV